MVKEGRIIKKLFKKVLKSWFLRKLGDSNPRYGCPYVSLANWWFQPLTQTSFLHKEEVPGGCEPPYTVLQTAD